MIKLNYGYYIDADNYGYTLLKERENRKTNEKYYSPVTYHSSLENTLIGYIDDLTKKQVEKEECTINEVVQNIKRIKNEILSLKLEVQE